MKSAHSTQEFGVHWRRLDAEAHLGYRKNKRSGVWFVRWRNHHAGANYKQAPVGVAKVAKRFGLPVFCISGGLGSGADDVLAHGIDAVFSICDRPLSLQECMANGPDLIESAAARLCRIIKAAPRLQ